MQATQTPIMWTVIVAAIVLAVLGFFAVGSINNQSLAVGADIDDKIDTKFDTAFSELQQTATALQNLDTSVSVDAGICNNIDGCNGWRLKLSDKLNAIDRVTEELTDNDNRDLFKLLGPLFSDLDDGDDITSVDFDKSGRIRSNEELDSNFDLSDTLEIYGEFVLEVEYDEDGSGDSNREFVKITFVLNDLEDGIDNGEILSVSAVEWDRDASLGSN